MANIALIVAALIAAAPLHARDASDTGVPSAQDAPVAMLVDISSGQILHARNPDTRFVPASITKVMTMFLAFELIGEGQLDPAQMIPVAPEIAQEWSGKGSTMFLAADEPVRLSDMLTGIANVSANDAAIALATTQAGSVENWTKAMTAKAHDLGMTDSHFKTPNGWPDGGQTFTTANDLVLLAQALIARHPVKYRAYMGKPSFTYNSITQNNYDPLIGRIKGADGIKTGFTNEAGYNYLGTAKRNGQRLVLVLAGTRSVAARARMARQYIEWGFEAFERRRLYNNGAVIGQARVQGGSAASVDLVADGPVFANFPKAVSGETPNVQIQYTGPLRAPIEAGQRVGVLEITIPGMEKARIPLLAKDTVGKAGFFRRIYNGIAGWLS